MGLFTKGRADGHRPTPPREEDPALRRVKRLPQPELVPWAETCLYSIGRSLQGYQSGQDPADLAEATLAVETLATIIAEINARADA